MSYISYIEDEDGEIMNIQNINNDIKTRQWVERIKECRDFPLENGASRTTYVSRPTTAG